ncbi:hypothetical protein ACFO3J_26050 [Streptomyces polygonati]|uniref:Uncharacterized protein n=1 Tax=Streptomyces polygonati TaxID=1617087 RepID=A0ABV8HXG9_9ACTN
MNELLTQVIDTYGGLDRWNGFSRLTARVKGGGALWVVKGQEGVLDDYTTRIDLHRQYASHAFGGRGLRSVYTPDRVAVETEAGAVVEERTDPRSAFAGHDFTMPWDRLHLAYFTGYAMWTYLTEPFSLAAPGSVTEELEPWREEDETWRRLKVVLPAGVVGHGRENVYYIDEGGLIRRHDYVAEVLGKGAGLAAHLISGHREFDGIVVPTERRVWRVGQDGRPDKSLLSVSIDVSEVSFA